MVKGELTMSQKEIQRLKVLEIVIRQELTVKEASIILSISERQTYRILKRYKSLGTEGLIHRLRGKPSNRGYPKSLQEEVLRLYRKSYPDFGATLFAEKLLERHSIAINHETIRRWLRSNGEITASRRSRRHRKKRERKTSIGEMLQFDGSPHDWFEGRSPACTLLHAVDDASGKVFLRFAKSENARSVLETLREYVEENGAPHSIYTDRYSVYYAEEKRTDFQKAMDKLSIRCIYANSPQAKGRVERGNRTLQDRLVKEMRLERISSIEEANKFLRDSFIEQYNEKFARTEGLPDIHIEVKGKNLDNIFCFETERQVKNDYTISLSGKYIQLVKSLVPLPLPKRKVIVRKYLDDSLHIFDGENELKFKMLNGKPTKKEKKIIKPSTNHPWRNIRFGKAKY